MIGLLAKPEELPLAQEFFQLFKTPWEPFQADHSYDVVLSTTAVPTQCDCKLQVIYSSQTLASDTEAGVALRRRLHKRVVELKGFTFPVYGDLATVAVSENSLGSVEDDFEAPGYELIRQGRKEVRLGFDLFRELDFLLRFGQPPENAQFATLDFHIEILRRFMLDHGLAVIEIPPAPAGTRFISCLTHDIDFVSLRHHRFDRAAAGFFYRATLGTVVDWLGGRGSWRKLGQNALAVFKWPLVQLGLLDNFWLPFANYLAVEQGKPSTFFLIPFKNRRGKAPPGRDASRRAVRYDLDEVREWIGRLCERGCEVAVHGLDAWNDRSLGREELNRIASSTGERAPGVRMHWLFFSPDSPQELEAAGFGYDSTCGYNDAVGYRAGTAQVFRPPATAKLLELPLHLQDTAMFFPGRMHLTEPQAWERFTSLVQHARCQGGVLTVLWHDRSLVPERLWGDFYRRVLKELSEDQTWFATARDVVGWFESRRQVSFRTVCQDAGQISVTLDNVPADSQHDLALRVMLAGTKPGQPAQVDVPLKNRSEICLNLPDVVRRFEVPVGSV